MAAMRAKDVVGRYGEDVASQHLLDAGLVIISRNWRCKAGELDIVASEGPTLVFCEVKTRTSLAFGDPAEAVSPAKAARIRRLAVQWLGEHRDDDSNYWPELRFDVVAVLRPPRGIERVEHIRGAF
jgi:putative endonuclease